MLLPEGNGGVIVGCGFEMHDARAAGRHARFAFGEKERAGSPAAVGLEDVDRDNIADFSALRGDAEADDLVSLESDNALGARKTQIVAQILVRIGDFGRVAELVNGVDGVEIGRGVIAQADVWMRWHGRRYLAARRFRFHTSKITGRIKGRFEVCLFKNRFRSTRIFSLMTLQSVFSSGVD